MKARTKLTDRCVVERMTKVWAHIKMAKRHVTATELAVEFECTTKTIYRDIEFLRDRIGLPIESLSGGSRDAGFSVSDTAAKLPWWTQC